jgi:hypothetical protein
MSAARFLILCTATVIAACGQRDAGRTKDPGVSEADIISCFDAADNDGDGLVDCDDTDCVAGGFCNAVGEICDDRIDNDGDGDTDCDDILCADDPACLPVEDSLSECRDGDDNDADGDIDCADDSCSGLAICGPENTNRACQDDLDNDGDADVDCDDSDCDATPACATTATEDNDDTCSDEDDNDGDSDIDCMDADCRNAGVAGCSTVEDCDDTIDNDGDGDLNCNDSDCSGNAGCNVADLEDDATECANGTDDDADDLVDCADTDCLNTNVTWCGAESTQTFCADNIDNDGDGTVDCADSDCATLPSCANVNLENDQTECSDGADNDDDALIDCADPDCKTLPICGVENTDTKCADEFDNDGDGDVDCDDSECATQAACSAAPESNCTNGTDDDSDGNIDCFDTDCAIVTAACGAENTDAFCGDTRDNDADGNVDCADPDCTGTTPCRGTVSENCTDAGGLDEDLDGYANCADFDCLLNWSVAACDSGTTVHLLQNAMLDAGFSRGDATNDPVRLRDLVVTFVDPANGASFWAADQGDSDCLTTLYTDGLVDDCYRGVRVFVRNGSPGFAVGDVVDVAGLFMEFNGESEILAYATRDTTGTAVTPVAQATAIYFLTREDAVEGLADEEKANDRFVQNSSTGVITDPYDDILSAERLEGMLMTVYGYDTVLQIVDIRTNDAGAADAYVVQDVDYPEDGTFLVGTRYFQFTSEEAPVIGQYVESVSGILMYQRRRVGTEWETEYRLQPRAREDWVIFDFVDTDEDGLDDDYETSIGTDPNNWDSDFDLYDDFTEIGSDPSAPSDVDGDGAIDALDSFMLDRDGDGWPNEFDALEWAGATDDRDGDGLSNEEDSDDDGDGICDPGVAEGTDGCVYAGGVEDLCPLAPDTSSGFVSFDYVTFERLQYNSDMDAELGDLYDGSNAGDSCDFDADGDLYPNPVDNCPFNDNGDQLDTDGNGIGDVCDFGARAPYPCEDPTGAITAPEANGGWLFCDLIIEEVLYRVSSANGAVPVDANRDGAGSVTDDEFIEIRNVSGSDLDLSGMRIYDGDSITPRHIVPAGTILRHNQRLVVFGGGTPRLTDDFVVGQAIVQRASSSGKLGLNNESPDAVVLAWPGATSEDVLAYLFYGDAGEPVSSANASISRYPDGTDFWYEHPVTSFWIGGAWNNRSCSPGQAPDTDQLVE